MKSSKKISPYGVDGSGRRLFSNLKLDLPIVSLHFRKNFSMTIETEEQQEEFTCTSCSKSLTGHRYILKEEKPHCIQCYEEHFANICELCKDKIGCDSKSILCIRTSNSSGNIDNEDLSYKERHWHERCFKCSECSASLVDKPFATKDDVLFCSDCHDNRFAIRCDSCSNVFKAGMRKYEYRGKQWHEECFLCLECKQPIGSKSFIPRDQEVCCVACYEQKYAQRCKKCSQVIKRGGVTYKAEPYHKECLVCANCDKQLAGIKFTSKDDQPYCSDCYGQLFAKKCCRCAQPITIFTNPKAIQLYNQQKLVEQAKLSKKSVNAKSKRIRQTIALKKNVRSKMRRFKRKFKINNGGKRLEIKAISNSYPINLPTFESAAEAEKAKYLSNLPTGFGGCKFISFEDRHWHSECFICYKCNVNLVGKGFLTDGDEVLCPECGR